jgi:hypothetical protein
VDRQIPGAEFVLVPEFTAHTSSCIKIAVTIQTLPEESGSPRGVASEGDITGMLDWEMEWLSIEAIRKILCSAVG